MSINVASGVVWQKQPKVENVAQPGHNNWVVWGDQRVEVPGTAGWRSVKKSVYLQHDGSWSKQFFSFPSKEIADSALAKALGEEYEPAPVSALALAFQKARR